MRNVDMPRVFITIFVWSHFVHLVEGDTVGRESNSECYSGNQEHLSGVLPLYILFSQPGAHKNAAPSSQRRWRLGGGRAQEGRSSAWSLQRSSNAARAGPGASRKRAAWSSPGSF